jgi:hypothetical protein
MLFDDRSKGLEKQDKNFVGYLCCIFGVPKEMGNLKTEM